MNANNPKFRVFISYTSTDRELAEILSAHIHRLGHEPIWDRDLEAGDGFTPQIKNFIVHSHVFIPLVTGESTGRDWVNQEIGYALALNIPVLPVAIGCDPPGIIRGVQAVRLDPNADRSESRGAMSNALLAEFGKKLPRESINSVVKKAFGKGQPTLCRFVRHNEDRIRLLGDYAGMVAELRDPKQRRPRDVMVRQKTGLTSFSSFCVKNVSVEDNYWMLRYAGNQAPTNHYIEGILRERDELVKLVSEAGCRLIIHPQQDYAKYGDTSKLVRLAGLIAFLEDARYKKVHVAISDETATGDSLTLVGDWFSVASVAIDLGSGFRQTVFSLHAPSNVELAQKFDQEFEALLELRGTSLEESRSYALRKLRRLKEQQEKAVGFRYPDPKLTRAKILSALKSLSKRRGSAD